MLVSSASRLGWRLRRFGQLDPWTRSWIDSVIQCPGVRREESWRCLVGRGRGWGEGDSNQSWEEVEERSVWIQELVMQSPQDEKHWMMTLPAVQCWLWSVVTTCLGHPSCCHAELGLCPGETCDQGQSWDWDSALQTSHLLTLPETACQAQTWCWWDCSCHRCCCCCCCCCHHQPSAGSTSLSCETLLSCFETKPRHDWKYYFLMISNKCRVQHQFTQSPRLSHLKMDIFIIPSTEHTHGQACTGIYFSKN